jgi:hypothetical protein
MTIPTFNYPNEINALYCSQHKKENMINFRGKKCRFNKCKKDALFGFINKKPFYCCEHKENNMINIILDNKCCILECENEYNQLIDSKKYCNNHIPINYLNIMKRLCKYCDIQDELSFICKECNQIKNKKEWSIVRYLRQKIDTKFEYNSSKMLNDCSKRRPDIYFELNTHCLIVEIDENQHNNYEDNCECARINEIVNGIGGKPVIIIRYNPDKIKNKGKEVKITKKYRLELLVNIIKKELDNIYERFCVKIIQLFYNVLFQYILETILPDPILGLVNLLNVLFHLL